MAGYSAAIKLNNLVITSFTTLANGISNYTAQNLGAEKPERVRAGFKSGLIMVWLICIPLVLLYVFAGKWLIYIFMDNPEGEAMAVGMLFLRIVSPFYFVASTKLVADGILRGARMMIKFMIATFTDLILRVVLAFALSLPFGSTGIWIAWPIGWSVSVILSVIFCLTGVLRNRKTDFAPSSQTAETTDSASDEANSAEDKFEKPSDAE